MTNKSSIGIYIEEGGKRHLSLLESLGRDFNVIAWDEDDQSFWTNDFLAAFWVSEPNKILHYWINQTAAKNVPLFIAAKSAALSELNILRNHFRHIRFIDESKIGRESEVRKIFFCLRKIEKKRENRDMQILKFTLRLSPYLEKKISFRAMEEGLTKAKLVRKILESCLD